MFKCWPRRVNMLIVVTLLEVEARLLVLVMV